MYYLVVVHEFAKYKKGDHITDEIEITKILATEQKHYCVKCQMAAAKLN